jgi:hypothetical protein
LLQLIFYQCEFKNITLKSIIIITTIIKRLVHAQSEYVFGNNKAACYMH